MNSTRPLRWVLALVFASLMPRATFAATCILGELCPGRIWDPAGLQFFQNVSYNPVQDHYLLATSTWVNLSGKVIVTSLDPDGTLNPTTTDVSPDHGATAVATAYNSVEDGYLAVWRTASPTNIYIRHLDSDGIPISNIFTIGNGDPPSVAYSPHQNRYVVTWYKLISGLFFTFYAVIDGDPTNPSPVLASGTIDSNALSSVVAYNPTSQKFLIVFVKDFAPAIRQADIFGRTVNPDLSLGPVFGIDTAIENQQRPVLTASQSGFLVVYEDWSEVAGLSANAIGARLDANGGFAQRINVARTFDWDVPGAVTYNSATDTYIAAWRSAPLNNNPPQHWAREFNAQTGAAKGPQVFLSQLNASILSAAARPDQGDPQAIVVWAVGAGQNGVHAGIIDLPPAPPAIQPPMPTAFFNLPYDQKVPVAGGSTPLSYELVSGLASLTALNLAPAADFATTGRIVGTANTLGTSGVFRVRVTDADLRTDEKDLTVTVVLAPPTPIAPSGGINDPTPTFSWSAVPGATSYNLVVDNLTDGGTPIDINLASTSHTPVSDMPTGKNYQWRVRAINGVNVSAFSANVPFEIDVVAPGAAALNVSIPLNFAQLNAPAFQTSGDFDATTYDKAKATDGNVNTYWSSPARNANQNEFLTVNLGSVQLVSRVRIRSLVSLGSTFPVDFTIGVSTDNVSFTTVSTSTNFVAAPNTEYSFPFADVSAQYVRIFSTKVNPRPSGLYFTQIAEFAVDGSTPSPGTLKIAWNAPGDDGSGGGAATSYDLRASVDPITLGNFSSQFQIATGTPQAPGAPEEVTFGPGLFVEFTYHFALITTDNAGNPSIMTTASGDTLGVAPGAPTSFTISNPTGNSLQMNWVASGDDGPAGGPAFVYEGRYATFPLNDQNFGSGTPIEPIAGPLAPGTPQNWVVPNLNHTTTYYFGLRAWDEKSNISPIVFASGATLDLTPPFTVDDLTGVEGSVTSTFLDMATAHASSGDINVDFDMHKAVDENPATSWSTPARVAPQPEFLILNTGAFRALSKVRLQARDVLGALFPEDYTIDVSSDGVNYVPVAAASGVSLGPGQWIEHYLAQGTMGQYVRLNVTKTRQYSVNQKWYVQLAEMEVYEASLAGNSVTVNWTAPADDGSDPASGPASMYTLKMSLTEINNDTDFNNAFTVATGAPQAPGMLESVVVDMLPAETRYHFRLKTSDEVPNTSMMSNPTTADTPGTPPSAVTTLAVTGKTGDSITIGWNATGDDGMTGQATRYDIRISLLPISAADFDTAPQVVQNIVPGMPGAGESFAIPGLGSETTYFIALKVLDELDNASGISNLVSATTDDITPPGDITDLAGVAGAFNYTERSLATVSSSGDVAGFLDDMAADGVLATSWSTPARTVTQPEELIVQVTGIGGSIPIGRIRLCARAETGALFPEDFVLQVGPTNGNWFTVVSETGFVATAGTCYPFTFTPVDGQFVRLSVSKSRLYAPNSKFFVQLADIFVDEASSAVDKIFLSWTTPGDNGFTGQATAFDIRYSTTEIMDLGTFNAATPVPTPPLPGPPNVQQQFTLDGLDGETMYYIAMRTRDEVLTNWSGLSNVITATTAGVPPSPVTDLAVVPTGETTMDVMWTATGDDGMGGGPADHYDLRIGNIPLSEANFDVAGQIIGEPAPLAPTTPQSMTIGGLQRDTTYWLAMKVVDKVGAPSVISNIPFATTDDNTLPSPVTIAAAVAPVTQQVLNPAVTSSGDINASFAAGMAVDGNLATSWSTPARDVMQEESLVLNTFAVRDINQMRLCARDVTGDLFPEDFVVELSTDGVNYGPPVVNQVGFAAAAGSCHVFPFTPTSAQHVRLRVTKSRQYVVNSKFYVQLAEFQVFESVTLPDRITLTFNATGDDGMSGNATEYDVRYSTMVVPFESATQFVGEPVPSAPGTPETIVVTGLSPSTTYHFAVKVIDNRGNASPASNVATETTGSP